MTKNLKALNSTDAVSVDVPKGIIRSSGTPAKMITLGLGAMACFNLANNAKSDKMQNLFAISGVVLIAAAVFVAVK